MTETAPFAFGEDPDHPGWYRWQLRDSTRFNAMIEPLLMRLEGETARVRMFAERRHTNVQDMIHGGATLAFIDVALFAAARMFGLIEAGSAVTLDLSTQFLSAGRRDEPLDAEVELLRETRRLLFMRGLVVQGETRIAAFSGTIRKSVGRGVVEA